MLVVSVCRQTTLPLRAANQRPKTRTRTTKATNNQNRTWSRRFSLWLKRMAFIAVYKIKTPKHKAINNPEK